MKQVAGSIEKQFSFTKENNLLAERIIAKYPSGREASAVLALLDIAQRQAGGWLPVHVIEYVADYLKMPYIRVYEVASFYTMFNLKPVGKYHVQICGTTPCYLRGAKDIAEACEKHLDVKIGGTTSDNMFTLSEVECLGGCVNAPIVQINDDYYEDLDIESALALINELKAGKKTMPGSQKGRQCSMPEADSNKKGK